MYADDSNLCSCAVILLLGLTLIRVHHNISTAWSVSAYRKFCIGYTVVMLKSELEFYSVK